MAFAEERNNADCEALGMIALDTNLLVRYLPID